MSSVAEKVKSIIVEQLGVEADEVTPEASFTDDLGAIGDEDVLELFPGQPVIVDDQDSRWHGSLRGRKVSILNYYE